MALLLSTRWHFSFLPDGTSPFYQMALLLSTRSTVCLQVQWLDLCGYSVQQGRPVCVHIGRELAHGLYPVNTRNTS